MSLDVGKIKFTVPELSSKGAGAAKRSAVEPQAPLNTTGLMPRLNGINGELAPESRSDVLGQRLYTLA